jgi:adenosylcobyric acid synthase
VETVFEEVKILGRPEGRAPGFGNAEVSGYEIHHGRVRRDGGESLFSTGDDTEGCMKGTTLGTSWHGVLESDGFRRALLLWVARERSLDWSPGESSFAAAREAQLEKLGDLVAEHVDREALMRLVEDGSPSGLPVVSSQQGVNGSKVEAEEVPRRGDDVLERTPLVFTASGDEQQSKS